MKCPEDCPLYQFIEMTERLKRIVIKIQMKKDTAAMKGKDYLEPDADLRSAIELALQIEQVLASGALDFEKQLEGYRDALRDYIRVYQASE